MFFTETAEPAASDRNHDKKGGEGWRKLHVHDKEKERVPVKKPHRNILQ